MSHTYYLHLISMVNEAEWDERGGLISVELSLIAIFVLFVRLFFSTLARVKYTPKPLYQNTVETRTRIR